MSDIRAIAEAWMHAKQAERAAIDRRRDLEDQMVAELRIPETLDGTELFEDGVVKIKIVGRITRKVDGDLAQEIAAENGLTEHLATLFRWSPELNLKAWAHASPEITGPLSAAITAKPGRPSFTITQE
jgi:hypothetical protein